MDRPEGLTPLQQRIWDLLSDGRSHPVPSVLGLWRDEFADLNNMRVMINSMRKRLLDHGLTIISEYHPYKKITCYRLMRILDDE